MGGVEIFLVITSYLLTFRWLEKERTEVKPVKLLEKRIIRLYPAFLALILPVALAFILYKHAFPDDLVWYLFSAQNFYWVITDYTSNLITFTAHTWYITLDVYLFLIWVLVLRIVPRKRFKTVCWIAIFIAFAYRILTVLFTDNSFAVYIIPFGQLDSFALGGLLAYNFKHGENSIQKSVTEILGGLIGIVFCIWFLAHDKSEGFVEVLTTFNGTNPVINPITANVFFFIALLGVGLLRYCLLPIKHPILSNKLMAELGTWTYVLYIVHWPVLVASKHFNDNRLFVAVLSLIVSMFLAWAWMRFIEPRNVKLLKR